MKVIDMGMNTAPPKGKEELEVIEGRFRENCGEVPDWLYTEQERAETLRQIVINSVEIENAIQLSWSCDGETRFNLHAHQWKQALPQYDFKIERYSCKVYKK
jgi:hypothetical protein